MTKQSEWLHPIPENKIKEISPKEMLPVALNQTYRPKELELMDKVRDAYNSLIKVPCTACQYCMPCPQGVDIPKTFAILNNASLYDGKEKGHANFEAMVKNGNDPRNCVGCGACEAVCPQHINIIEMLKMATEELA